MAIRLSLRLVGGIVAGLIACQSLAWSKVTLVSSSRNKIYLLINEGIQQTLQTEYEDVYLSETPNPEAGFEREKPKRVITIGNAAALWAKKNVREIPVTASGVILRSNPRELRDATGVRLDFPFSSYLKLLNEYLPEIRTAGFIYDSALDSPFSPAVRKQSEALGLRIEAVPAAAEKEISAALDSLKDKGVEAFIATYDPIVMNPESIQFIVEFCIRNRIALIVPSKALLKSGGLLSLEADYVELGRQTGSLINRLLREPGGAGDAALEIPLKSEVGINLKMAEVLNIRFKESVANRADYIHR